MQADGGTAQPGPPVGPDTVDLLESPSVSSLRRTPRQIRFRFSVSREACLLAASAAMGVPSMGVPSMGYQSVDRSFWLAQSLSLERESNSLDLN